MEKLVVIPTYNERENISKMISKVMSLEGGYHLLVVDDGSPDGTGAIVKERQAEFPDRLFLVEVIAIPVEYPVALFSWKKFLRSSCHFPHFVV